MGPDHLEGRGETSPSTPADLITDSAFPLAKDDICNPLQRTETCFLQPLQPGPCCVVRSITKPCCRDAVAFKHIQDAQCLLFFNAPPINSLGYVIGCSPLTADLLITIKSLSGTLYFDLSLHNIKGLYIKGGTKMIRLIRRDQRKIGNNWKKFHWYFQSKEIGNYGCLEWPWEQFFSSPFQQLKMHRSCQNKLIFKKKFIQAM